MKDRTEYAFRPEWARFLTPMFEEEVAARMMDDLRAEGRVLKSERSALDSAATLEHRGDLVAAVMGADGQRAIDIAAAAGLSADACRRVLVYLEAEGVVVRSRGAGGFWLCRLIGSCEGL